ALTYAETGGIVAALTTSLPEQLRGERNWDYRYCWLRDATFTLMALVSAGYREEARAWGQWLRRSVAGSPHQLQIMYGLSGERQLIEWEVPGLPGSRGAAPVRVGNAASAQLQLDVYGELIDALYQGRTLGLAPTGAGWPLQQKLIEHLEQIWEQPDEGIWEVRGGRRHFTFPPRSWPGWRSIVRCVMPSDSSFRPRWNPGGKFAIACMRRFASGDSTACATPSRKASAVASSMRVCCSSLLSASYRRTIHAYAARSQPSNASSWSTGWCCGIEPRRTSTAWRREKVCFSRAVSGLPTIIGCSIGMPKHAPSSSVSSRCATMLVCLRKNTIRRRSGSLAI